MIIKVQYTDNLTRQQAMETHKELLLVEEQNIAEGNFLIFSDEPLPAPVVYVNVPQEEFERMQRALDELILGGAF